MNGIDLTIVDNTITNLDEILNFLQNAESNANLSEHLKTLKNNLSSKDITNKELLEKAIDTKLIEYGLKSTESKDNITTLRILQNTNVEFKKIGIIETPPEKNDSNRYIDYITYTNDDGTLDVLCCNSHNFINDYLITHKTEIANLSPKEIFKHFEEYIHRELKFISKEEYEKDRDIKNDAQVREDQVIAAEYELMEDYKNRYAIQSKIEMTTDQFGVRLYRLGDGLFTFKTINNNRVMETLKTPTIEKNNIDEMLDELDKLDVPQETPQIAPLKPKEEGDHAKSDENYELIESEVFDEEKFKELTAKKDVYEVELTAQEEHVLNTYIKYLIVRMEYNIEKQIPFNHDTELIYDYLESPRGEKASIVDIYQDIQLGYSDSSLLSGLEKEFARHYLANKENMQNLGLNANNVKKLELFNEKHDESGISTVVMLMEIIILAMFVIMILRLDI